MKFIGVVFLVLLTSFSLALAKFYTIPVYQSSQSTQAIGYNDITMQTNGEHLVIKELIKPGDVVFDVGANRGEWSSAVLSMVHTIKHIYAFEPIPTIFDTLQKAMQNKPVHVYQVALSNTVCRRDFLCYSQNEEVSQLSTFYRRPILYDLLGITPEKITVDCTSLDRFCAEKNIQHIDYLKIDTEGSELDVLQGAQHLLKTHSIQHIQFEYGGTYNDAAITLKQVMTLLTHNKYVLFRIFNKGLIHIASWQDDLENYIYSNYIALVKEQAYPYDVIDNL